MEDSQPEPAPAPAPLSPAGFYRGITRLSDGVMTTNLRRDPDDPYDPDDDLSFTWKQS